jgi:pyruvate/2-oxoacid:ferredoxin oxidoreductase alpha subunit
MAVERKAESGNIELLSGNYSAALGAKLCRAEVISAYPITPQTTVVERLAEYIAQGELKAKFIPAESEHSALSILVAASSGGVRTFTATSRHGIALMHEVMHWAGRGRCPIVMAVATASLGPPPDIGIEQDDAMVERDVAWVQFYCQSNQEILDTIIMAFRIGEMVSLPVMVAYDGFITSHTYEPVLVPDIETVDSFLPPRQTRFKLDVEDPLRFFASPGAVAGAGYLAKLRRRAQDAMEVAEEVAKEVRGEFYQHFGRRWDAIECYRTDDAETIIIAMTSVASIAHEVVDELRAEGKKVGLIRVAMLRPFPIQDIAPVIKNASKVAVIDRNISYGHGGILAIELRSAMYTQQQRPPIFGFIGGLAGLSVTAKDIRQVVDYVDTHEEAEHDIIWLGIPAWEG